MALTFDQVVKLLELLISFVGLLFVIIGWVLPYRQSLELNKINQEAQLKQIKREWKMQLLDQQISKYYGPISALIQEQSIVRQRIQHQIGRNTVFDRGREKLSDLAPDEQLIWKHFVDTYKIPLQHRIVEIMKENAHLAIHGEHDIYVDMFLDYVYGWELLDSQKREGVPNFYEYYYSFSYPVGFNDYINGTLRALIEEKESLMKDEDI